MSWVCNVIEGSWSDISKVHTPIEGNKALSLEDLKNLGELENLSSDAHSVVANTSAMQLVRLAQLWHGNDKRLSKINFLSSLATKVSLSVLSLLCVNFTSFVMFLCISHLILLSQYRLYVSHWQNLAAFHPQMLTKASCARSTTSLQS